MRNKLIKYGNYKNGKLNGKAIVISKAPSISSLGLEKGDLRNNYQDNGYFIKNGDHLNGKLHGRAEAYTALVYHAFREGEQVARPARDISKIQPEYLDTYIIKKLSSFEGDWKNGEEDGYGTHTWSNGTKIYGQYKDGKKVGQHKKLTVKRSNQNSTNTSSQSIKNERSTAARFIGDANRTGQGQHLAQFEGNWNGTLVGRMVVVTGEDTSNKDDGHLDFFTTPQVEVIQEGFALTQVVILERALQLQVLLMEVTQIIQITEEFLPFMVIVQL